MSTYTLEVPATKDSIDQLVLEIVQGPFGANQRITLNFGSSSLTCSDEAERAQFGTKVRVVEAVQVLLQTAAAS